MKKYTLIIFIALYSSSEFFGMDQKTDLQELVLAQKATQASYDKHLEQISFTAFHPDELNTKVVAQKANKAEPVEQSLYGRFSNLPIELRYEILQYLCLQAPERLADFPKYTIADAQESELIKDVLRTQYWLQKLQTICPWFQQDIGSIEHRSYIYDIALFSATQNLYGKHNFEIAALALTCGAGINKECCMLTPLSRAAEHNLYPIVKMLLERGASAAPYASPLFYAIKNDNVAMTKLFIDNGINLSHKNDSLMHTAARMNAHRIIKFLHDECYNIDANDTYINYTSLHAAAHSQSYQAIETLLELGANPELTDADGKTYQDILDNKKKIKLSCADLKKFR